MRKRCKKSPTTKKENPSTSQKENHSNHLWEETLKKNQNINSPHITYRQMLTRPEDRKKNPLSGFPLASFFSSRHPKERLLPSTLTCSKNHLRHRPISAQTLFPLIISASLWSTQPVSHILCYKHVSMQPLLLQTADSPPQATSTAKLLNSS